MAVNWIEHGATQHHSRICPCWIVASNRLALHVPHLYFSPDCLFHSAPPPPPPTAPSLSQYASHILPDSVCLSLPLLHPFSRSLPVTSKLPGSLPLPHRSLTATPKLPDSVSSTPPPFRSLSVCLSACLSLSVCLSVCLSPLSLSLFQPAGWERWETDEGRDWERDVLSWERECIEMETIKKGRRARQTHANTEQERDLSKASQDLDWTKSATKHWLMFVGFPRQGG